ESGAPTTMEEDFERLARPASERPAILGKPVDLRERAKEARACATAKRRLVEERERTARMRLDRKREVAHERLGVELASRAHATAIRALAVARMEAEIARIGRGEILAAARARSMDVEEHRRSVSLDEPHHAVAERKGVLDDPIERAGARLAKRKLGDRELDVVRTVAFEPHFAVRGDVEPGSVDERLADAAPLRLRENGVVKALLSADDGREKSRAVDAELLHLPPDILRASR